MEARDRKGKVIPNFLTRWVPRASGLLEGTLVVWQAGCEATVGRSAEMRHLYGCVARCAAATAKTDGGEWGGPRQLWASVPPEGTVSRGGSSRAG